MKSQTLVSVVIPCFNQGQYLRETLDSILTQTYKNYEVIIVNDGSTEAETLEVLNDIKQKHISNLRILDQANQGLAMARNNGFAIAKGEFVLPLDSDDYISQEYLEETVGLSLMNKKAGAVTTYIQAFGAKNEIWETKKTDLLEMLVKDFVCGNSLIRKASWTEVKNKNGFGYNPNMKGGYEDWDFWISLLEVNDWEIDCVKKPLFHYRVKKGSMYTEARKNHLELYGRILYNHKDSFQKYYREVIMAHLVNYGYLNDFADDLQAKNKDINKDINNPVWLAKKLLKVSLKKS
jgi:glycosyltransferase involved in cell wall biosynthesis